MSRTAVAAMDLSLVSAAEEKSLTGGSGPVTCCVDDSGICTASEELCPMGDLLCEKDRKIAELQGKLDEAQRAALHLSGLAKLGELSAVVAHEIRNPLTGISTTAEVLLDDLPAGDPRHESVGIILGEIQRLERIVRNLLDFARDRKPFITRVDLRDVIERVLAAIDHQVQEHGVTVNGSCPDDLPDAHADPDLVEQAFTNIALNAVQAISDGGELTVALYARTDHSGPRVKVAIADSGCGVSKDDRERIFDPFFTTKAGGAGLGLAVSKKIIESQNGSIAVDSETGRGTTFVVSLPAAR